MWRAALHHQLGPRPGCTQSAPWAPRAPGRPGPQAHAPRARPGAREKMDKYPARARPGSLASLDTKSAPAKKMPLCKNCNDINGKPLHGKCKRPAATVIQDVDPAPSTARRRVRDADKHDDDEEAHHSHQTSTTTTKRPTTHTS